MKIYNNRCNCKYKRLLFKYSNAGGVYYIEDIDIENIKENEENYFVIEVKCPACRKIKKYYIKKT